MKILFLLLISLSFRLHGLENEKTLTLNEAISLAFINNHDLHNLCKKAQIHEEVILNAGSRTCQTSEFVTAVLSQLKNNTKLQLAEIRSDITREVLDMILELKTTFYSLAALQELMNLQNEKVRVLEEETQTLEERYQAKQLQFLSLKLKQKEYEKAKKELEFTQTETSYAQTKLYHLLGMNEQPIATELEILNEKPQEIDLASLKKVATMRRPDLLALKIQLEELATFGAKKRWWTIKNLKGPKPEIEISPPPAMIDFRQAVRARYLCEFKEVERLFEATLSIALQEVEEAFFHYKNAKDHIETLQRDGIDPYSYTVAKRDFLIAKALLEHATGEI